MKVGYVVSNFPSLSESFILDELIELQKLGVDIYVFSIRQSSDKIQHEQYNPADFASRTYYFSENKKSALRYLKSSLTHSSKLWGTLPAPRNKFAKKVGQIIAASELAQTAQSLNLDLLHAHFDVNAEIAAYLAAQLDVPFTFTKHTPTNLGESLRALCQKAAGVVAISRYNREALIDLGVDADKVAVVHCGTRVERFKQTTADSSGKSVLSVSRLVEKKGTTYLIEAFAALRCRGAHLRIVGSGSEEAKLHALVKERGLGNRVEFFGSVNDDELLRLYRQSSVFALPCVVEAGGDVDGLPVAIVEAMACGLPVVSTFVSGIPEIVEHQHNGLLVEPRNLPQLAEALDTLLCQPDTARLYGQRGRRKVEAEFDVRAKAVQLAAFFESRLRK
jgi:glycosyltransferase involved in cell wall biosynthesis